MSGSHNWAILLTFDDDDGENWIFRSPRPDSGFSQQTITKMIKSEVASIKASKMVGIPVVEVKSYCDSSANEIGIPYILTTEAPGFSISSRYTWNPCPEGMKQCGTQLPCLPNAAKEKIMKQLGVLTSKILRFPFDRIGSLCESEGEFNVGECLSRSLTWSSRDSLGGIPRGPFSNDIAYYKAVLSALRHHAGILPLDYVTAVQLWNDFVTIDSKIESSMNRLDYIALADLLLNVILSISMSPQKFYLKPPELSMSNIFIDNDFNVSCIIDWTSCFTVPLPMLLINPSFPQPRDEPDVEMISIFQKSVISHSTQTEVLDSSSWDLARKLRLFMQLADLDGLEDYFQLMELYTTVHQDASWTDVRKLFNAIRENGTFIDAAKCLLKEDLQASDVQEREREYFTHSQPGAEDRARKLSDRARTENGFVADCNTWKSIAVKLAEAQMCTEDSTKVDSHVRSDEDRAAM